MSLQKETVVHWSISFSNIFADKQDDSRLLDSNGSWGDARDEETFLAFANPGRMDFHL